ncbi:alternative oxidase [Nostoc sp. MS1]|uniref:alternative oxidase n=1 Tax=Nostoc sp. MS1 TaxID=2764711 RepID=UPI001CC3A51A|nr:alternative oxidase [Nostoc sp. MS1]BCL35701.1 hypothetical protein NSMS1_21480 [Nostoc sp. MS1]
MWRKADWLKVHFAESWNELHHLLIMESLGGADSWGDRFLAKTTALIYYWTITLLYFVSPRSAYRFMELVEQHAYESYNKFLTTYEAQLKAQAAPEVAKQYYRDGDLYMFDEFQTSHFPTERRPKIDNLYDVFVAIRDDEMEHVKTMLACQQTNAQFSFKSPHNLEGRTILITSAEVNSREVLN